MSGFVALLADDPRPQDASCLAALTAAMAYRGPDASGVESLPHCGLGFALLDTTDGQRWDAQPRKAASGDLWIVADVRLDARSELLHDLERSELHCAADSALILAAYERWGEACAERLLGDFSFVIWDAAAQRLFAARDPLGMRPMYFVPLPQGLLIGNTLHALRRHPQVSNALNDAAVADFLLFGANYDLSSTVFAQVRRLPPAHLLTWRPGDGAPRSRRYLRLEARRDGVPRRFEDAVEEYRHLLRSAVEDRLTSDRGAIFLSGGMDSPAVAALAWQALQKRTQQKGTRQKGSRQKRPREEHSRGIHSREILSPEIRFEAYTAVYERLLDDSEGPFARAVSEHLGLVHHVQPVDDFRYFEGWERRFLSAEPADGNMLPLNQALYRRVCAYSRVAFTGDGADPALILPADDLWRQLLAGRFDRVGAYLWQALRQGRRPPLGLRTAWLSWRQRRRWRESFPTWLNGDLVRRLDLEERWRQIRYGRGEGDAAGGAGGERGEALASLVDPIWVALFESEDPGSSGCLLERRHPFFDLRLLRFSLALPAPWCRGKQLLRQAMVGILPECVLKRPKTPLAGTPRHLWAAPPRRLIGDLRVANPLLMEYLDASTVNGDLDRIDEITRMSRQGSGRTVSGPTTSATAEANGATRDSPASQEDPAPPRLDDVRMRAIGLGFWLAGLAKDD